MTDWTDPGFIDRAHAWIGSQVTVTSAIEQPHVQWWSTAMRVPTVAGVMWFKAVADEGLHEVPLTALLAHLYPDDVPELIATDVERGWMLMRDGGERLRESGEGVADWEVVLPRYAEMQLSAAPLVDRLLDMGVPDERLTSLPERVERLLTDEPFLMLDQPDGLTTDERVRLEAQIPEVAAMCVELAGIGIPETIQHDDLHGGAILVREGHYRVFDWGDACVSHPFHTLTVLLRATAWKWAFTPGGPEMRRMRDAYLEPFARFGSRDELVAAADLAYRTGTLARSLSWYRALAARPPAARSEDLDSIAYGLQRFLEHGPIGSWRWDQTR